MKLFLQGDGNIRYFEITTEKPYIQYLMEFRSPAPQKGLGKSGIDQMFMVIPAKVKISHLCNHCWDMEEVHEDWKWAAWVAA